MDPFLLLIICLVFGGYLVERLLDIFSGNKDKEKPRIEGDKKVRARRREKQEALLREVLEVAEALNENSAEKVDAKLLKHVEYTTRLYEELDESIRNLDPNIHWLRGGFPDWWVLSAEERDSNLEEALDKYIQEFDLLPPPTSNDSVSLKVSRAKARLLVLDISGDDLRDILAHRMQKPIAEIEEMLDDYAGAQERFAISGLKRDDRRDAVADAKLRAKRHRDPDED